jgi:hypothetical protein
MDALMQLFIQAMSLLGKRLESLSVASQTTTLSPLQMQAQADTQFYMACLYMISLSAFALWTVNSFKTLKARHDQELEAQKTALDLVQKSVPKCLNYEKKHCEDLPDQKLLIAKMANAISTEFEEWGKYLYDKTIPVEKLPPRKKSKSLIIKQQKEPTQDE